MLKAGILVMSAVERPKGGLHKRYRAAQQRPLWTNLTPIVLDRDSTGFYPVLCRLSLC